MDELRLGSWELGAFLGEGSTGRVYEARSDLRAGAIKVLRPPRPLHVHEVDPAWTRIEARLQQLARVDHPNVIAIWDWGRHPEDVLLWIAMERLHGMPLSITGPMDPSAARRIGLQAARGLLAVHDADVVHGDLKPHNLFLLDGGRVVLLDFAIAFSPSGALTGSPRWMAPETLAGDPTSAAADVYALGQILAELLLGRAAFEPTGHGMARLLDLHADKQQRDCVDPGPSWGELGELVRACTARSPDQRPTTRELVRALQEGD